jgi:hypothetical protein
LPIHQDVDQAVEVPILQVDLLPILRAVPKQISGINPEFSSAGWRFAYTGAIHPNENRSRLRSVCSAIALWPVVVTDAEQNAFKDAAHRETWLKTEPPADLCFTRLSGLSAKKPPNALSLSV